MNNNMNGYNLIRAWYNFKFENPSITKSIHSDLYCFLVDKWNRLGQKTEFGLPTEHTMECMGIGSYNTYKKALNALVNFGFIEVIKESKNQHQSRVIALSQTDKATDKALDKATIKATDKALDSIDKQINNKQINKREVVENNHITPPQIENKELLIHVSKHTPIDKHFLEIWNKARKVLLKVQASNFNNIGSGYSDLKYIYNNYTRKELTTALNGLFRQKGLLETCKSSPIHFLSNNNFEKYLDAGQNKIFNLNDTSKPKFNTNNKYGQI